MFVEIDVSTVPLTKKLAMEWSTAERWRGERELSARRLGILKEAVETGTFYSPHWAVAQCGMRKVRVNGQHSSTMLSELSDDQFPKGLKAVIHTFMCDSDRDIPDLFSAFDRSISARRKTDQVRAHVAVEASLFDVGLNNVSRITSGIAFFRSKLERHMSAEVQAAIVHDKDDQEFILWANSYVTKRPYDTMPVVAAMYGTWLANRDAATEFWSLVTRENHPDVKNPTRVLARWLVTSSAEQKKVSIVAPKIMTCKCIRAWNAWREGRTTDLKYIHGSGIPRIAN